MRSFHLPCLALAMCLALVVSACATTPPPPPPEPPLQQRQQGATQDPASDPETEGPAAKASRYPPRVHMGEARLECDISSSDNGKQVLTLEGGAGIEFDATVSPLVDGTVSLLGEKKGGEYRFTSHLAEPAEGRLTGVGDVVIEELDTRVTVALDGYDQPDGPGTAISFSTADMQRRGVYIEFQGIAQATEEEDKTYAFRVNLGAATSGSGEVLPADSDTETEMMAKRVVVQAPTTTSSSTLPVTTTVQETP